MSHSRRSLNSISPTRSSYRRTVVVFLGLLGAANQALLALYTLATYQAVSAITPMGEYTVPTYSAIALSAASAIVLVYGSFRLWQRRWREGGIVNLLAGIAIAIPVYVYLAYVVDPSVLLWLGPAGALLLVPAIVSGVFALLLS